MTLANSINSGTIASQDSSAVVLTGGFINGVTIGNITPAVGNFTYIQTALLTNSTAVSNYIVDITADAYFTLNTTNNSGTDISLPAVSTAPDGWTWGVTNLSTGTTTIHAAGGDNINGASSASCIQYQTITLQKSRTANTWIILNEARSTAAGLSPASTIKIVDDTTTNASFYPAFVSATSGQQSEYVCSTKLSFNPSTGILATTLDGAITAAPDSTNTSRYLLFSPNNTGTAAAPLINANLNYNPSSGILSVGGLALSAGIVYATRVVTASGAVTVTTSDYYISINKTVGAATTVNLPSSPVTGQTFIIKDGKFDAATNNITLTPAAGNIDNASTYIMNINGQSATVIYNGTQWEVN